MSKRTEAVQKTYKIDTFRQGVDGVFRPLIDSIFLLVAISFFDVNDFWKSLISASNFCGFLITMPLIGALNNSTVSRAKMLALLTFISALFLFMSSGLKNGALFALSVAICSAFIHIRQPFFTELYSDVYPREQRAERLTLGLWSLQIAALSTGLIYGWLLNINLEFWRWIMRGVSILLLGSSFMLLRLPFTAPHLGESHWWRVIIKPFRNRFFLYVQAAWMLLGFSNLWTLPLRAVYLAEKERGLGWTPIMVTIALVVLPSVFRFIFNAFWARLYSRLGFLPLRIIANIFFIISIPLFFSTKSMPLIMFSSVLLGIGTSATPFIWQLWVTAIVPPSEVRIYQAAHASLAGIRGILAPFVGFAFLNGYSFRGIGFFSSVMGLVATLMMLPLLKKNKQ